MSILMPKHGVCYGQSVTDTEVQQRNTQVQIGEVVLPNHAPPLARWACRTSSRTMESPMGSACRTSFRVFEEVEYCWVHRHGQQSKLAPISPRCREVTLSSTGVNSNVVALSCGLVSITKPAWCLLHRTTLEKNRAQPLFWSLVTEPTLCLEESPTNLTGSAPLTAQALAPYPQDGDVPCPQSQPLPPGSSPSMPSTFTATFLVAHPTPAVLPVGGGPAEWRSVSLITFLNF